MTVTTPIERRLSRTVTTAPPAPGFGGAGHEAVFVIDPEGFVDQDPFIMLADDRLDMPVGATVGGEHPHAGFEIATFVARGELDEGKEGVLHEGDLQWTTTGRGIVHGERVIARPGTRILQLWFALPAAERWAEPHYEVIRRDEAPVRREPGVVARVYSGSLGELQARRREQVPLTIVDIRLTAGATFEQELPASHNGFLYVLDGVVRVGADALLRAGQVGWLDRHAVEENSMLRLVAGGDGARVMFYAGQPQRQPIVAHGPFVGGSRADLMRMSRDFVEGRYRRMSELASGTRG